MSSLVQAEGRAEFPATLDVSPPVSAKLWGSLLTLLPDPEETLFLRACLGDGEVARDGWDRWRHAAGPDGAAVRRTLAAHSAFLPLLLWNLRRIGVDVDGPLVTYLRSAHLTEELRCRRYRAVCASALEALRDADIPFIVLKGAALGETVYPSPTLRHADDVDLLVRAPDLARAAARLGMLGWRESPPPLLASALHWPPLIHPSGLPLELHHRLLVPYYTLPYERLWARSRRAAVAGVDVAVLSAADTLLHVCAHAMLGGRILRWVPDAWFILERDRDLEWSTLVSTAVASRLALPVYLALWYFAGQIGGPVPREAIALLRTAAARTDLRGRCAAQLGARQLRAQPVSRWRHLLVLWRRAFPPPLEFALRHGLRWWQLPLRYAQRLARYARRTLRK